MPIERLTFVLTRGPKGYGLRVQEHKNAAYIDGTQDAAEGCGILHGDKIVAIDGQEVETHKAAVDAIKKCPEKMKLLVERDPGAPPLPKQTRGGFSSRMMGCSLLLLLISMGASTVDLDSFLPAVDDGRPPAAAAVNPFTFNADDTALDPHAMAHALRSNEENMGRMRKEKPEWAKVIDAEDLDVAKFQAMVKEDRRKYQRSQDMKLNEEDGSAVDPAKFLAAARKDKEWMAKLKKEAKETYDVFKKGDHEELQEMLRSWKRARDPPPPPPPPPPATPYDNVGQVDMSFRILTDEGEEKDLYMLKAERTDDEKVMLPVHMRCDACQATSFQGALSLQHALETRRSWELVSATALTALETLCDNATLWGTDYGVVPTKTGVNALSGKGIPERPEESLSDAQDIMMQTTHSNEWGKLMANMCSRLLLGAEVDEDELVAAVTEAMPFEADGAVAATGTRTQSSRPHARGRAALFA